jgi:hypothetical protein
MLDLYGLLAEGGGYAVPVDEMLAEGVLFIRSRSKRMSPNGRESTDRLTKVYKQVQLL